MGVIEYAVFQTIFGITTLSSHMRIVNIYIYFCSLSVFVSYPDLDTRAFRNFVIFWVTALQSPKMPVCL